MSETCIDAIEQMQPVRLHCPTSQLQSYCKGTRSERKSHALAFALYMIQTQRIKDGYVARNGHMLE